MSSATKSIVIKSSASTPSESPSKLNNIEYNEYSCGVCKEPMLSLGKGKITNICYICDITNKMANLTIGNEMDLD